MRKFKEAISSWSLEELRALEEDIKNGGKESRKALWEKIQDSENNGKFCAICFKELEYNDRSFTLFFGPSDFKKKASFCAIDCLEYFMNHLKELDNERKIKN